MKKKRTWIILGIIVALSAGGVYLATRQTTEQTTGQTRASRLLANLQTASVTRTTLSNSVESSGSIAPEATVQLSFGTAGAVGEVTVAPGDPVKRGEALATLDTTDLQLAVTQAAQAYLIQQLTYSATLQADAGDIAVAQASYNSALAAYNAARQDYESLPEKERVQCSQLTSAQQALDRAQTAYDRLANDAQAKNYLSSDWGPFRSVVNGLTNAQAAYDQALANCNIARLNLNDSALRSAQTQLQSAKSKLDNLLSPRAETLIQAQAKLEQARLSLDQAQQNLAEATLVAPFDGVITAVNIQAGGSSGSGAAIEMVDARQLHVDVLVDETEIAIVQAGQKVELTLDALTGITLTGQVARIDPAGTVSNGVVNYNVRVDLDVTAAPLRLDMTANAAIRGKTHENVLAVPTSAIRQGGQGGFGGFGGQSGQGGQRLPDSFVLVIANGQPRPVEVMVGMTAGDLTEVSGELQEGDQVVISTLNSAQSGGGFPGGFGFFGGGGPPDGGGGPPPGGAP
ncbi:MAG TPA: efflux RND transporter periplasmic adaptor subunit [Anaerolineae bacterium]|nr:efflux RND transporter periplasmic adaptor subunit [Anaerolineae bacterium]